MPGPGSFAAEPLGRPGRDLIAGADLCDFADPRFHPLGKFLPTLCV